MDMDRTPESDSETIFALDNVPLELPIAGAASRSLAAVIDYLLLGTLGILWPLLIHMEDPELLELARGAPRSPAKPSPRWRVWKSSSRTGGSRCDFGGRASAS